MVAVQRRLSRRRPFPQRRGRRSVRRGPARDPSARRARRRRSGGAPLSSDMLGLAWGKLLINLNNAVNALSGRTLIEELQAARLPPRRRRLAARRPAPAPPRGDQAGQGRAGRPAPAAAGDRSRPTGCSTTSSSRAGRSTPRRARRWPTTSPPGARPRSIIINGELVGWPSGSARRAGQPRDRRAGPHGRSRRRAAGCRKRFAARCSAASGSVASAAIAVVARQRARPKPGPWSRSKARRWPLRRRPG